MSDNTELIEKIIRLINLCNQMGREPRDYSIGQILYPSEIHTIEAIHNHTDINASELSKRLGITNGAVNQITNKLEKKGLIVSYHLKSNKRDVYYKTTALGEQANTGHTQFHEKIYKRLSEDVTAEELQIILRFLDKMNKEIAENK